MSSNNIATSPSDIQYCPDYHTNLELSKCFMRSVPKEDPTHLWLVYLTALDSCVLHVQSLFIRFMLLFCEPQG